MLYHGCDKCLGLLTNHQDLQQHKFVCTGHFESSNCPMYACDRDRYMLLMRALHPQISKSKQVSSETNRSNKHANRKNRSHPHRYSKVHSTNVLRPPARVYLSEESEYVIDESESSDNVLKDNVSEVVTCNDTIGSKLCNMSVNEISVRKDDSGDNCLVSVMELEEIPENDSTAAILKMITKQAGHTDLKDSEVVIIKQDNVVLSKYTCTHCQFATDIAEVFTTHSQQCDATSTTDHIEQCESENDRKSVLPTSDSNKSFICEYCSKAFLEQRYLDGHLLCHTGDFSHQCKLCTYKCRNRSNLTAHMKSKHSETVTIHVCKSPGCTFSTRYRGALKCHVEAKHEAQRRYACVQCKYNTNNRASYHKHTKIHNDDKKHSCAICMHRAMTKHDLSRHMRSHTNEKVYFCDVCPFSTGYCSAMKMHLMRHKNFKPWQCTLCKAATFVSRMKALHHVRTHHSNQAGDASAHVTKLAMKFDIDMKSYRRPKMHNNTGSTIISTSEVIGQITGEATAHVSAGMDTSVIPAGGILLQDHRQQLDLPLINVIQTPESIAAIQLQLLAQGE